MYHYQNVALREKKEELQNIREKSSKLYYKRHCRSNRTIAYQIFKHEAPDSIRTGKIKLRINIKITTNFRLSRKRYEELSKASGQISTVMRQVI